MIPLVVLVILVRTSHYNCKIIIGLDTHNPADFSSSDEDIAYAEEIIKKYHLRYIDRLYL